MKVDVTSRERGFHYRLTLEDDDRSNARRTFTGVAEEPIRLIRDAWDVHLPSIFTEIHPDLHAAAVWYILRPFIGGRLALPFGVSSTFAEVMARSVGVVLPNVDPSLQPRQPPSRARPCVLLSGGMDSAASVLILPDETAVLFLDRIVVGTSVFDTPDLLIDLKEQRATAREVQRLGRDVYTVRDSHEALWEPYPSWHSEMSVLLPLYMADTLRLETYETGDVLGVFSMKGYHDGEISDWRFVPTELSDGPRPPGPLERVAQRVAQRVIPSWLPLPGRRNADDVGLLSKISSGSGFTLQPLLGLRKASSTYGLSEVATAFAIAHSPLKGKTFSCYYPSDTGFCMKCDKCFKKLLLLHIADGEETPPELIDHFLSFPYLAAIFERGYVDWHHVWFYIFQKLRCSHPFVQELQRQAQKGPDLSFLARWYPGGREAIPAIYRDEVVARIDSIVGTMTPEEARALESLSLPPLRAPLDMLG